VSAIDAEKNMMIKSKNKSGESGKKGMKKNAAFVHGTRTL
jgi:hypothetical protein